MAKQTKRQALSDQELKDKIKAVLEKHYPTSLNELGRLMGYGKISGSLTKRIRTLLPKLPEYLEKNEAIRALDNKPKTSAKKSVKKATKSRPSNKSNVPDRCEFNGYRPGSNYALCFDCLYEMGYKKTVSRRDLLKRYAELSGKDLKRASFDLAVILSVREDGRFHRSADSSSRKYPHFVKRVGEAVQLVIK